MENKLKIRPLTPYMAPKPLDEILDPELAEEVMPKRSRGRPLKKLNRKSIQPGRQQNIYDFIKVHPGCRGADIARELDITDSMVYAHLGKLAFKSLVKVIYDGRGRKTYQIPVYKTTLSKPEEID